MFGDQAMTFKHGHREKINLTDDDDLTADLNAPCAVMTRCCSAAAAP